MMPLSAIIVDDHQMVSEGFKVLLRKMGKFGYVTSFYSVSDARQEMLQNKYDYLFSDLLMPGFDIKEFIGFARETFPDLIIIIISSGTDISVVRELFKTGVNAYLSKSVGALELKNAIEKIDEGEKYISTDIASKLVNSVFEKEKAKLSKREVEILKYVADGKSITETAAIMHLSHHTIIAHRRNIMEKLGLHSAPEMVKYAYENNLL
jgi:DNA-binding NarL/FixJ family response regulator